MDTTQLVLLVGLSGLAITVAFALQKRRPEPPTAPSYRAPGQVDRNDFDRPTVDKLVVVFSSSTCSGCVTVWEQVSVLASDQIAVQNVEVAANPGLHKRYKIDGVPTTLVVGADGAVSQSFFGPMPAEELKQALS